MLTEQNNDVRQFYYANGTLQCEGKLSWFDRIGLWHFYNQEGVLENKRFYGRQLLHFYKSIDVDEDYENVCECT